MTMQDYVNDMTAMLGMPANENIEGLEPEKYVEIAFKELKRYIKTPVAKTVPYSTRIDLAAQDIKCKKIWSVRPSIPRIGLTMSSIDSGNVFQVAASVNVYSAIGNTSSLNIDPIMTEMAMAQVRNTLGTDFQFTHDKLNNVLYVAHRDPRPACVTITYTPILTDVSEVVSDSWQNYILRMATANFKVALGRTRSKYKIAGSNVELDGETLLNEGNEELRTMREELGTKRSKLVVLN